MAIYKNKDIVTNINERGVDLGNINVNFYTEDNGTASIRIKIKNQQGAPINFNNTDMLPRLDLYAKDGSIFTNEPVDIILQDQGLIQYKVSDYVIRHEGKMDCKLFLENGTESVHVANFYFVIKDSGITGAVGKEIRVEVLEDMVGKVLLENAETFRADPIETAEHLKPTVINSAKEEFERLSTAKQVDSEVINARGSFNNLNERLGEIENTFSKEKIITGDFEYKSLNFPTEFPKEKLPFNIYRDKNGIIQHDFNVNNLITGTELFINADNGNDNNDGLSEDKAVRSLLKAIELANALSTDVIISITSEIVNRKYYAQGDITLKNNTVIRAKNNANEVLTGSIENTLTWTEDGNAFKTNRSAVKNVLDNNVRDKHGLPVNYKKVSSIEEVKATKGSYYTDGTDVWVRKFDDTIPDKNLFLLLNTWSPHFSIFGKRLVVENIKMFNVYDSTNSRDCMRVTGDRGTDLYVINSAFNNGGLNGLAVKYVGRTFVFNSICSMNGADGFNYHAQQSPNDRYFVFEWNCVGFGNGVYQPAGAGKNNATTAHDGMAVLRINSEGYECDGPILADVNGCISVNYNCVMYDSTRDKGSTKAGFYFDNAIAQEPGSAYVIDCVGGGNNTYSLSSDKNIEVKVSNLKGYNILPNQNIKSLF